MITRSSFPTLKRTVLIGSVAFSMLLTACSGGVGGTDGDDTGQDSQNTSIAPVVIVNTEDSSIVDNSIANAQLGEPAVAIPSASVLNVPMLGSAIPDAEIDSDSVVSNQEAGSSEGSDQLTSTVIAGTESSPSESSGDEIESGPIESSGDEIESGLSESSGNEIESGLSESSGNETEPAENLQEHIENSEEVSDVDTAQQEASEASGPTRYITIGSNPGDARCMVFDDRNVSFGSADISDWSRLLGKDPRFFVGREFLAIEDNDQFGKVLRQKYVPNYRGSAVVATGANIEGHRTYRVVQSIYFEEGFDWGGEQYQQTGKIGFGFGSGTYPTGGNVDPDGFTARLIWRGNRNGDGNARFAVYSYAADRDDIYGEDIFLGDDPLPIGEWIEVVLEVTANSSIHSSDGSLRGWINGELKMERNNMGWQQGGDTPSIDQIFYTSFYGGNSTDWSPDSTTHARFADVCWAPVVNGYSGIDPDSGVTKINPAERNVRILDDNVGAELSTEVEREKFNLEGMLGAMAFQADQFSVQDSIDLFFALSGLSKPLNDLIEEIKPSNIFTVSENPIEKLEEVFLKLDHAIFLSGRDGLFDLRDDLVDFQESLTKVAADVAGYGQLLAQENWFVRECNTISVSPACTDAQQHLENAQFSSEQMQLDLQIGSRTIFDSALDVWQYARLAIMVQ